MPLLAIEEACHFSGDIVEKEEGTLFLLRPTESIFPSCVSPQLVSTQPDHASLCCLPWPEAKFFGSLAGLELKCEGSMGTELCVFGLNNAQSSMLSYTPAIY